MAAQPSQLGVRAQINERMTVTDLGLLAIVAVHVSARHFHRCQSHEDSCFHRFHGAHHDLLLSARGFSTCMPMRTCMHVRQYTPVLVPICTFIVKIGWL